MRAQRCPVELLVRNEARMPSTAAAVELHLVDGRMSRARQALEQAERRERHVGLLPLRAREGVPGRERVVHDGILIDPPDGSETPFCGECSVSAWSRLGCACVPAAEGLRAI